MGFLDDVATVVTGGAGTAAIDLIKDPGKVLNPGTILTGGAGAAIPGVTDIMRDATGSIIPTGTGKGPGVSTAPPMTPEQRQARLDQIRREREADITTGQTRGRELFRDRLGRLGEQQTSEMAQLMGTRRQQAEQGLGAEAFQAARESRLRGLGRQEEQQRRQLAQRQAQMGLRGGAAAGQLAQLMGQQQSGRQAAEQDLLLADVAQRQGLSQAYERSLGASEADRLARQKFNLAQRQKELFGELASGLGEAQIGSAERGGLAQTDIGKAMAQAMAAQGGGGKK